MSTRVSGDTAYFPGSGPANRQCSDCTQWHAPHTAGRCRKAAEMRRVPVMKLEPIIRNTPACKYFKLRGDVRPEELE